MSATEESIRIHAPLQAVATHEPSDDMAQEVERRLQLAIAAATLVSRKVVADRPASLSEAEGPTRPAPSSCALSLTASGRWRAPDSARVRQRVVGDGHPGAGWRDVAGDRGMARPRSGRGAVARTPWCFIVPWSASIERLGTAGSLTSTRSQLSLTLTISPSKADPPKPARWPRPSSRHRARGITRGHRGRAAPSVAVSAAVRSRLARGGLVRLQ
jgi:hypothetical protein